MHQDAFAADYQEEEYRLIGLAIKFAGISAKKSASLERTGRLLIKGMPLTEPAADVTPSPVFRIASGFPTIRPKLVCQGTMFANIPF